MKTIGNQGFLPTLNIMGRRVPVKMPAAFQTTNKINDFEHILFSMIGPVSTIRRCQSNHG